MKLDLKDAPTPPEYPETIKIGAMNYGFFESINKTFIALQKFGLYIVIFTMLGVYIGISTSKIYYTNKITDIVKVGAFLFQEKVYQINLK